MRPRALQQAFHIYRVICDMCALPLCEYHVLAEDHLAHVDQGQATRTALMPVSWLCKLSWLDRSLCAL